MGFLIGLFDYIEKLFIYGYIILDLVFISTIEAVASKSPTPLWAREHSDRRPGIYGIFKLDGNDGGGRFCVVLTYGSTMNVEL